MFLRGPERPTVELYGKLPIAKDYLRVGLGSDAGVGLREWLDTSYSTTREHGDELGLAGPLRFVAGDDWNASLQGVIWPSSDAGGHRRFPFVVAVERKRKALVNDVALGFPQAEAVWRELVVARELALSKPDGKEALAALRGRTLEVPTTPGPSAGGVDLEDWLTSIWGESGREGLHEDLDRLRTERGGGPVRLPLAAGPRYRAQVAAWHWILQRLEVVNPRRSPTLFFPLETAGTGHAFMTVFREAPSPRDAHWLDEPNEPLGALDLARRGPQGSSGNSAAASEAVGPLVDSVRGLVTRYLASRGA